MLIRSAKIQFLFWTAFFSVLLYIWIVTIGLQTFVLPDEKPMEFPQNTVLLMFVLYGKGDRLLLIHNNIKDLMFPFQKGYYVTPA